MLQQLNMLGAIKHIGGRHRFVGNIGNGDGGNMFISYGNLVSMASSNFMGNRQRVGSTGCGIVNSVLSVVVSSCLFDGNTGALPQLLLCHLSTLMYCYSSIQNA